MGAAVALAATGRCGAGRLALLLLLNDLDWHGIRLLVHDIGMLLLLPDLLPMRQRLGWVLARQRQARGAGLAAKKKEKKRKRWKRECNYSFQEECLGFFFIPRPYTNPGRLGLLL